MMDKENSEEVKTSVPSGQPLDNGDVDVIEILLTGWRYKYWIMAGTVLITVLGIIHALRLPPVFHSEAIVALKEGRKSEQAAAMTASGILGGFISSQMGFGNTNLDKMDILINGHKLAKAVITKNNLMPKLFPESWDSINGTWQVEDSIDIPTIRDGIESIQESILSVAVDHRRSVLTIGVDIYDPHLAKNMVDYYLKALSREIRNSVKEESEKNRQYLSQQLKNTADPIICEKLQNMIAHEIEKSMLVASEPIEVLQEPVVPLKRIKPQRRVIATASMLIGFFISIFGVILWVFTIKILKRYRIEKHLK
ncbi:Wzz/FepE/Etk N-terminal domain-containing protein [Fibrobacterota bacterium]